MIPPDMQPQVQRAIAEGDLSLLPGSLAEAIEVHTGCHQNADGSLTPTCRPALLPLGMSMEDLVGVQFQIMVRQRANAGATGSAS